MVLWLQAKYTESDYLKAERNILEKPGTAHRVKESKHNILLRRPTERSFRNPDELQNSVQSSPDTLIKMEELSCLGLIPVKTQNLWTEDLTPLVCIPRLSFSQGNPGHSNKNDDGEIVSLSKIRMLIPT